MVYQKHRNVRFLVYSVLILLFPATLLAPVYDFTGTMTFKSVPHRNLSNARIVTTRTGTFYYTLEDTTYEKDTDVFVTDIVLSFNKASNLLQRDDTRKYIVLKSSYDHITDSGATGKGCAQFFKRNHEVIIQPSRYLWLGSCEDLGSFTIEFRIRCNPSSTGGIIFSRTGYFSGEKNGIEVSLRDNRIVTELFNIFKSQYYKSTTISLRKNKKLRPGTWYHYCMSFNRLSGKLATYINGAEQEVRYVTETGEPDEGVFSPSFGTVNKDGSMQCPDSPTIHIGRGFSGMLDEFRISYIPFEALKKKSTLAYRKHHPVDKIGRIPLNIEGVVTSSVHAFKTTGTMVTEFTWGETLPQSTYIWCEFRTSDTLFSDNSFDPKWIKIQNGQKNIYRLQDASGTPLRGKYYQWRFHLISSPDGKRAPSLKDISLKYRLDTAPLSPIQIILVSSAHNSVTLKWKKNLEQDILGYRIYYGTRPGRYDGIISHIDGKEITHTLNTGSDMQITITNDIINQNHERDTRQILSYPLLNANVLYYFSISAYDNYKPGSPHNHESSLSKPVTARVSP